MIVFLACLAFGGALLAADCNFCASDCTDKAHTTAHDCPKSCPIATSTGDDNESAAGVKVYDGSSSRDGSTATYSSNVILTSDAATIVGGPKQSVTITATIPPQTSSTNETSRTVEVATSKWVTIKSNDPLCTVPVSETTISRGEVVSYSIALSGSDSGGWTGSVKVPCKATAVDVPVTFSEGTSSTMVVVQPLLQNLIPRTKSVASGGKGTGRVKLNQAWPSEVIVTLESALPAALGVPAVVTVPAGATIVDFPVTGGTVAKEVLVRVTGTCSATGITTTAKASFTVLP
jgi:hypothetical protein